MQYETLKMSSAAHINLTTTLFALDILANPCAVVCSDHSLTHSLNKFFKRSSLLIGLSEL